VRIWRVVRARKSGPLDAPVFRSPAKAADKAAQIYRKLPATATVTPCFRSAVTHFRVLLTKIVSVRTGMDAGPAAQIAFNMLKKNNKSAGVLLVA
jgi:hypothetical protein